MSPLDKLAERYMVRPNVVITIYNALSEYSDQDQCFDMTESVVRALCSAKEQEENS